MRYLFCLFVLCWAVLPLAAQSAYFQQETHYTIRVRLDDRSHRLHGHLQLRYVNHSPDTLRQLYFHLWANAYKNNQTGFAQQQFEQGDLSFYFSKKSDRGFMDSLQFATADGTPLRHILNTDTIDIARVVLNQPLAPEESIIIETPFMVQLPKNVSRLGHQGQSYQITQWYPKPAVYDAQGWHPMPYLDQGEFYSEYGSFDVQITLPRNYLVAATGTLHNPEEIALLADKAQTTARLDLPTLAKDKKQEMPPSDSLFKTLRYTADKVHDFAWFADKRFLVLHDKAVLASGKTVDCFAFFTHHEANLWAKAAEYVARAVRFYSDAVGEYPYPQATAVQATIKAGGGMEYPMITVIDEMKTAYALDVVIAHEVGHNWFYGILGTNERDFPWLDEGFNSYIESRYVETYYDGYRPRIGYLAYLYQSHRGAEQPIQTHSNASTSINYYLGAYAKPTIALRYLEDYLGEERMRAALHAYFDQWKFKHPQPADVRAVFEQTAAERLGWFFDDLIPTIERIDYGWGKCQHTGCQLIMKGEIAAPVNIGVYNERDSLVERIWILADSTRRKGDRIDVGTLPPAHYYRIDPLREMPEYNRNDNVLRSKGLFRKGIPLRVRLLANFRRPELPTLCLLPLVAFNQYDGVMVGLAAYNMPLPERSWQLQLMPLFGTRSLSPSGAIALQKIITPLHNKPFERILIHAGLRSFTSFYNDRFDYFARYLRARLLVEIELPKPNTKAFGTHQLRSDNLLIGEETPQFSIQPDTVFFVGKPYSFRNVHRLQYLYANTRPLTPLQLKVGLEYANYKSFGEYEHQLKLSVEGNFRFAYSPLFGVDMRVFAGGFIFHTDRPFGDMPLQLISQGTNDYFYDDYWVARNEQTNFWSQQVRMADGGFKTPIQQVIGYGNSNAFIFAINLKADIPIKLPIRTKWVKLKPYLDLGYFKNTAPSLTPTQPADELLVNGGMMIDIGDGLAGFYVPLFGDNTLMGYLKGKGNFFHRISFSINFNRLNPVEFAKRITF